MTVYDAARVNMIESQLRPNKVTDERVIAAFMRIRRELFVPETLRGVAYVDDDLPLGGGRYLMKPMLAARLLAQLVRSVVALEENPELARIGRSALVDHRIASVSYVEAPLAPGHRQRSPYDLILFAGAVAEIPGEINGQLAQGGHIAVVLQQHECVGRATLITRAGAALAARVMFDAATPLLPGF